MTLSDGRVLAYTDLGGASSPVVMYFHGAPTSRLDHVPLDETLAELDVRMVSPDLPDGGSSPKPGRRLEDWPPDVAALADQLGIDRFAVMALSSGGPYAVACAALLPDRVVGAGVVSGVTDFGVGSAPGTTTSRTRCCSCDSATSQKPARGVRRTTAPIATVFVEGGLDELSPSDRAALEELGRTTSFCGRARRGLAAGRGQVTLRTSWCRGGRWPFDAAAITAPVWVLYC